MPIKLSFKDIIFVMEDVDAASPIVHSRAGDKPDSTTKVILEKGEGSALTKQASTSAGTSTGVGDEPVDLGVDGAAGDAGLMMAMLSSMVDGTSSGDKKGLVSICVLTLGGVGATNMILPHVNICRTTSRVNTCPSTTSWTCLVC